MLSLYAADQTGSVGGFSATFELCERLGVCHGPALLDGVAVVPLLSWYIRGANGSGTASLYVDKPGEDAEMTEEAW